MTDSYARGDTSAVMLDETIGANLERAVPRFGDREALVSLRTRGVRYTYAELGSAVDELARALMAAGLATGDRIGIWSPNCAEWTLVQYATAKLGAILVNINPAYRTSELEYALEQSGCRMLVAAPAFKTSDYRAMVAEVRASTARARARRVPGLARLGRAARPAPAGVARTSCAPARDALGPDDPINIQYTSGTTGFPKGATLTHRNILNNGYFVGEGCRYTEEDRVCIPVPFYHCFGMVMGNLGATTHGAAMVIPAPAFDPEATLEACAAGALHLALRRADDVHRPARPPRLRSTTT